MASKKDKLTTDELCVKYFFSRVRGSCTKLTEEKMKQYLEIPEEIGDEKFEENVREFC